MATGRMLAEGVRSQTRTTVTVSVIIPTYDRAQLVSRAIRSVLAQTFQDWELIVVDDGSTDNTEEVVRGFSDSRIRYVRLNLNRGAPAARNVGIEVARGEYVAFLDSDDEWFPEKLEKQLKVFRSSNRDIGAVYTGIVFIDEASGRTRIKRPSKKGVILRDELAYNPVGTVSRVMVKRRCLDEAGRFDENLVADEDWDMWIRLSERYEFDYVDEPLVKYSEHRGSTSANPHSAIAGRKALWTKHGIENSSRRLRALHYFRLGHQLCYHGHTQIGRQYLASAMLAAPWNPKYAMGILLSLLGPQPYHEVAFLAQQLAYTAHQVRVRIRQRLSETWARRA